MVERNRKKAGSSSTLKKALYALLVTIVFFTAAEIAFRGLGIFPPDRPFQAFKDSQGKSLVRYAWTSPNLEFSPEKPKGSIRIMVAGGSTALGFPYHPRSSFGIRLKALLEKALPGIDVEVINFGRKGLNSKEVKEIALEALQYHPDLFIVYTGQNEFIHLGSPYGTRIKLRRLSHRCHLEEFRLINAMSHLAALCSVALGRETREEKIFEADMPAPCPVSGSSPSVNGALNCAKCDSPIPSAAHIFTNSSSSMY